LRNCGIAFIAETLKYTDMKLKTFEDKRTFTEKTGILPERFTDWPNYEISIVTPEEQTAREKRIKPPPDHHFFDIQTGSLDIGKAPEMVFMEVLFSYYWQFKNGKTYTNTELSRSFTVRKFCQHHEIEKADLNNLISASYEIAHHLQTAWQADRYRPEILQQIELYLKERPTKKQPKGLEQMFDNGDLQKLVNILLERKFITKEPDGYHWTGIESRNAKGRGLQLVTLADVCRPLYKGTSYTAKELNQAWTTFFNYKMAVTKWQDGEIEKMDNSYSRLFNFVRHTFSIG